MSLQFHAPAKPHLHRRETAAPPSAPISPAPAPGELCIHSLEIGRGGLRWESSVPAKGIGLASEALYFAGIIAISLVWGRRLGSACKKAGRRIKATASDARRGQLDGDGGERLFQPPQKIAPVI